MGRDFSASTGGLKKVGSELFRIAEAGGACGDSAANLTDEFAVSYELFVFIGFADIETHIVQVAQVLVVAGVRHFTFCHGYFPQ